MNCNGRRHSEFETIPTFHGRSGRREVNLPRTSVSVERLPPFIVVSPSERTKSCSAK